MKRLDQHVAMTDRCTTCTDRTEQEHPCWRIMHVRRCAEQAVHVHRPRHASFRHGDILVPNVPSITKPYIVLAQPGNDGHSVTKRYEKTHL